MLLGLTHQATSFLIMFLLASVSSSDIEDMYADTAPKKSVDLATQHHARLRHLRNTKRPGKKMAESQNSTEPYIIGGSQAPKGAYEWFAQSTGCGGTLVHDDIILSAAHCLDTWTGKALVGAYQSRQATYGAQFVKVSQAIRHPRYNPATVQWDFLIVVLEQPVANAKLVKLNDVHSHPAPGESLKVIGFGAQKDQPNYEYPQFLMEAELHAVGSKVCKSHFPKHDIFPEVMVCAGSSKGMDTCYGDSGGPLFKNGVQVGITSWGDKCGSTGECRAETKRCECVDSYIH